MSGSRKIADSSQVAKRVVALVTEAMDLLDAHGVAPEAAAHLAMAQQQLRQILRA